MTHALRFLGALCWMAALAAQRLIERAAQRTTPMRVERAIVPHAIIVRGSARALPKRKRPRT